MERSHPPFKKRPNPRFNKDGNKRGKFGEESSEGSPISETVFRILCQSRRIGSVIGKAGGVIKALREETQAKITVAESVPGSEERVIIIYSPSSQPAINTGEEDNMELLCAAQDALIKVHDKIVEEDIFDDDDGDVVFARMLVPNNTVGCLLGRKGDVIRGLRNETGAVIRLLPADQLPICAMSTDEILQISGKPSGTRKALAKVSTLLHLNPRKDEPPSNMRPIGGHGSYQPQPPHAYGAPPPPIRPELSHTYGAPPVPWRGYATEPPRFVSAPDDHGDEPIEFPMKILCSEAKLGPIIGKNGISLRQFQQETGTSIHVDDPRVGSDERAILVSSFDALRNPRSRTIDAILILQDKTSEHDEKGLITTRLLIPSSKVGCILGQGGTIINEMRRRIRADIRVYAKDEKPICAGEDEELVQVSGSYSVAKEALAEIGSRFRARFLRDARPKEGTAPAPYSGRVGGHEPYKGVVSYPAPPREYEPHPYVAPPVEYTHHAYQVPPPAPGYPGVVDMNMANSGQVPGTVPVAHNPSEVAGARPVALQDPYAAAAPPGVDVYQGYSVAGGQTTHPVQVTYHETYGTQQGHYSDINTSAHTYHTTTTTTAATAPPAYPPPTQQGQYVQTAHQYGQ